MPDVTPILSTDTGAQGRVKINTNEANLNQGIADGVAALNAHRTSGDHDTRYHTKTVQDATDSAQNAALSAEADTRAAADAALNQGIADGVAALNAHRTSGDHDTRYHTKTVQDATDGAQDAALVSEAAARIAADDAETAARIAADNAEAAARIAADDAETAARNAADNAEAATRAAADTALEASKLSKAGGTMTGALVLAADATASLNPVTLQQLLTRLSTLDAQLRAYVQARVRSGNFPVTFALTYDGTYVQDEEHFFMDVDGLTRKRFVLPGETTLLSAHVIYTDEEELVMKEKRSPIGFTFTNVTGPGRYKAISASLFVVSAHPAGCVLEIRIYAERFVSGAWQKNLIHTIDFGQDTFPETVVDRFAMTLLFGVAPTTIVPPDPQID
jgi:hypothetical protein